MTAHVPGPWPALPYDEWVDTYDTLHMVMQILGKVRVALSPPEPEWAHVALEVTASGIGTGPVPSSRGLFEVEADLVDHQVVMRAAWGDARGVALRARPIAEFWAEFTQALSSLGVDVELASVPQEVPDPVPFPDDTVHHVYEPEHAHRFWHVLSLVWPVFAEYRAAFAGRVTPAQFFWGSMDLAVTRYSGRPCDPPAGPDGLDRRSYEAEQISAGWWPGNASFPEPAFYAYSFPKADDAEAFALRPSAASWNTVLGEHVLRYDDVRNDPAPQLAVREFLDSFYALAARGCAWDEGLVRTS